MKIDQYEFPDDLLYDKDHNWIKIDGNTATIGMTDFGQALAGELVDAEMPRVGRQIEQGQPFMSLESGKWVGRVKAIVSGKIVEANEEIEWESTIINEEPYGQGWFAKVELASQPEGLIQSSDPEYAAFIAAEREKYGK